MKKIFSALVVVGFLAAILLPIVALAQESPNECCVLKRAIKIEGMTNACPALSIAAPSGTAGGDCGTGIYCSESETKWGMLCLLNTLYGVTDWIFVVLVALAGLFVIIGAMTLLMSAGTPEKVTSGRQYIMYAAIGLIVGLLAKAIPSLVRMIAGM